MHCNSAAALTVLVANNLWRGEKERGYVHKLVCMCVIYTFVVVVIAVVVGLPPPPKKNPGDSRDRTSALS